jgi:hypothetical protein
VYPSVQVGAAFDRRRRYQGVAVSNLLQVMSLMAVPVVILGTIGYLNERANRRPIEGARRHGDAPIPVLPSTPGTETVSPGREVAQGRGCPAGSAPQHTDAGQPISAVTPSSMALQRPITATGGRAGRFWGSSSSPTAMP